MRERGKRGKSSVDDRHTCGTLRDKNITIFRVVLNEVKTHTAQLLNLCTSPECAVRQKHKLFVHHREIKSFVEKLKTPQYLR